MLQKPFTEEMLSNIFDKWTAYIKQLSSDDSQHGSPLYGDPDHNAMVEDDSLSAPMHSLSVAEPKREGGAAAPLSKTAQQKQQS
jgi:hypothetical protein